MEIIIEGMDGVGKTTVAKKLCDKYNFKYVDRPLQHLFNIGELGSKEDIEFQSKLNKIFEEDSKIQAWITGLGNIYNSIKYKNENVIIDRGVISNYFWNGNDENELIFKSINDLVGFPDVTIILYASLETRLNRIKARDINDKDLKDSDVYRPDGYKKMATFIKKYNIPYVFVNTENKTPDDVVKEIEEISRKSLLHFDLTRGNIFHNNSKIGIIDFDDAKFGASVCDVAIAIANLFFSKSRGVDKEGYKKFIEVYYSDEKEKIKKTEIPMIKDIAINWINYVLKNNSFNASDTESFEVRKKLIMESNLSNIDDIKI